MPAIFSFSTKAVRMVSSFKVQKQSVLKCDCDNHFNLYDLQDRDECLELPNTCGEKVKCVNTPGELIAYSAHKFISTNKRAALHQSYFMLEYFFHLFI